ncbi:MAG: nicotinate-nucleotide diphosphorylase (carboxylating), partial [Desulfovibrionaceae bacterium]
MPDTRFEEFFSDEARMFLLAAIRIALSEDGPDLTSNALFGEGDMAQATITAKQETLVCGLPLIPMVLEFGGEAKCAVHLNVDEGERVSPGTLVAAMQGPAAQLLKAERVILNFITHLSGIAELTSRYVAAVKGTGATVLDT